jgi:hypothetical protein
MAESTYIIMNTCINVIIKMRSYSWECRYENDYNEGLTCVIRCYLSVVWTLDPSNITFLSIFTSSIIYTVIVVSPLLISD